MNKFFSLLQLLTKTQKGGTKSPAGEEKGMNNLVNAHKHIHKRLLRVEVELLAGRIESVSRQFCP